MSYQVKRGKFRVEVCCTCRMEFGVTSEFQKDRKNDGDEFYCPLGHGQQYSESEEDRLREQLEVTKFQLEQSLNRERGLKAAKTRMINRAKNGVCPCCNRTFANMARHMKTKHPEYAE